MHIQMRRSYDDLVSEFPKPHLLVGIVGPLGPTFRVDPKPGELLGRLLTEQQPKGAWAIGKMQDGTRFALHCVFERKAHADRLASALHATTMGRYAGFAAAGGARCPG